ncbi:MAG: hypothetical protein Q8933_12775 [Bacteroidota bacterium]|nr:hypothetical protein [Bacteroidota bacterium]MDP4195723.1 hypothetical protein [Bacteroidota bacterium]
MTNESGVKRIYKYNLSFYYQSTIIYFVALLLYALVKGEFIEGSFKLITKDPVIYFFLLIVLISIASLLYNIYLNRHIEITDSQIIFKKGSKVRTININDIINIALAKERKRFKKYSLRIVRIKVRNRRMPFIILPYDYENKTALMEALKEIKNKLMNREGNV